MLQLRNNMMRGACTRRFRCLQRLSVTNRARALLIALLRHVRKEKQKRETEKGNKRKRKRKREKRKEKSHTITQ